MLATLLTHNINQKQIVPARERYMNNGFPVLTVCIHTNFSYLHLTLFVTKLIVGLCKSSSRKQTQGRVKVFEPIFTEIWSPSFRQKNMVCHKALFAKVNVTLFTLKPSDHVPARLCFNVLMLTQCTPILLPTFHRNAHMICILWGQLFISNPRP